LDFPLAVSGTKLYELLLPWTDFELYGLLAGFSLYLKTLESKFNFLFNCLILGVIHIEIGNATSMLVLILPDVHVSSGLSIWSWGLFTILSAEPCEEAVAMNDLSGDGGAHAITICMVPDYDCFKVTWKYFNIV
jgi:hypothetical protein